MPLAAARVRVRTAVLVPTAALAAVALVTGALADVPAGTTTSTTASPANVNADPAAAIASTGLTHAGALAPPVRDAAPKTLSAATFSLVSFDGRVARWNPCQPAITYRVNARLAGSSTKARKAAIHDVQTAFGHVARATGMTFRYAGTTKRIPRGAGWHTKQPDAEIVVAWTDSRRARYRSDLLTGTSSGVGGAYFRNWRGSGSTVGAATRGYVLLNARQNRMYRSGFGAGVTRGRLLLHEIGHVIGLQHVTRRTQVMYPMARPATKTRYRSGDLAGLKLLGVSAGCLDAPTSLGPDLS
jgi:hypothetical protein